MENKDFAKGFLVGAIAGVLGGIMFAPKKGEETRQDIKNKFNEIKDKVMEEIKKAEEFTKDIYDKAVDRVLTRYQEAKEITAEDADEISKIFEKSFAEIEKIIKKNMK